MFLNLVEMLHRNQCMNGHSKFHIILKYQDHCTKCGIVGVRETVDESVQRVSTLSIIINACNLTESVSKAGGNCECTFRLLTGSINELSIEMLCKQGVWQIPEELFQETSNTVDVVIEIFRVREVHLRRI